MRDTIKGLYPYALAEGEGVGTAYEYIAKAALLRPVIARLARLSSSGGTTARILVAGLPERYGTSLDFAILAHRLGAEFCVADERPEAMDRAARGIEEVQKAGYLRGLHPRYEIIDLLTALSRTGRHDAVLSCEVLQRLPRAQHREFAAALRDAAPCGALFVPNAENASHLAISGLAGFSRSEIDALFPWGHSGYVDMPPFPPGIARSSEQRARASSGLAEALAMRALDLYCAGERAVPAFVKRRFAHIVGTRWGV